MSIRNSKRTRYLIKQLNKRHVTVQLILVLVLALFLMVVYHRSSAKNVGMDTIQAALVKNTDIEQMKSCNTRDLMHFLSLDAANYDSVLYYKSKEALGAEEILILHVRAHDDLAGAKDAVDHRIAAQEKAFDGYGTKQMQQLSNAIIETKGDYLFYCVAEDPSSYEEVFRHAVQ